MLQESIQYLIRSQPFYAHLIMRMKVQYRTDIPTAGVNVTDQVNLIVNPNFWKSLDIKAQAAVLQHEALHCLLNHMGRKGDKEHKLFNIAADMAINDYIKDVPRSVTVFDKDGNPYKDKDGKVAENPLIFAEKFNLPKFQTAEFYYEALKQKREELEKELGENGGNGTIDDHSVWEEGDQDPNIADEKVKNLVKGAADAAKSKGPLPAEIESLLKNILNKPKDWRQELRRFVAKSSEILVESSRKVRNRRYGLVHPGAKKHPKLHLGVAIDTSGSVNDKQLEQTLVEIKRIHQNGAKVTVILCDSSVHSVFEYDPKKEIKVVGRGGTAFAPAFDEAAKLKVDALIYMTDGDDYGQEVKKPSFPVLWALFRDCKVRYSWGRRTVVDVNVK